MALTTMYDGQVNSPLTIVNVAINDTTTTIEVLDDTKIPSAPNLLVIGGDTENPETVKLTNKSGTTLTVERAFQGAAQSWDYGSKIGRLYTEYDFSAFKENIEGNYWTVGTTEPDSGWWVEEIV